MNGCTWSGYDSGDPAIGPWRNEIRDNDFSQALITSNVAWRTSFPVDQQRWPANYTPLVEN
jgi:hypothetical protein